ncbi:MAG: hypothetical protein AAGK97_17130 [Bacteroidota bacterium]
MNTKTLLPIGIILILVFAAYKFLPMIIALATNVIGLGIGAIGLILIIYILYRLFKWSRT